jgi:hypothetical protein
MLQCFNCLPYLKSLILHNFKNHMKTNKQMDNQNYIFQTIQYILLSKTCYMFRLLFLAFIKHICVYNMPFYACAWWWLHEKVETVTFWTITDIFWHSYYRRSACVFPFSCITKECLTLRLEPSLLSKAVLEELLPELIFSHYSLKLYSERQQDLLFEESNLSAVYKKFGWHLTEKLVYFH